MASSQAASDTLNSYMVYERQGNNAFIRSFKVVNGTVDGCGRTDGIDAIAADLGPAFPNGMFVCQDNTNTTPGNSGYQNFKFVPLERVVGLTASRRRTSRRSPSWTPRVMRCAARRRADGSSDPDGTLASYAWNFGDGSTDSGESATHTYARGGQLHDHPHGDRQRRRDR